MTNQSFGFTQAHPGRPMKLEGLLTEHEEEMTDITPESKQIGESLPCMCCGVCLPCGKTYFL